MTGVKWLMSEHSVYLDEAAVNERIQTIHAAVQTDRLTRPVADDHVQGLQPVESFHGRRHSLDIVALHVAGQQQMDLPLVDVLAFHDLKRGAD